MRDIAEKIDIAPGGLYNHFKDKDQIYKAIINKYHPWLLIPKIVKTAKGNDLDEFVSDASKKEQKALSKNKNLIKLHFIELVEFNGENLPQLFEKAFNEMVKALKEKEAEKPDVFKQQSITNLSRVLLGLFFSYMINDPLIMGSKNIQPPGNTFDYFNDIYLQGITSTFVKHKDTDDN
jgi:AcrR family transcriptional regulator